MLTTRFVSGFLACVLLVAVAGAWRLHTYNQRRAIEEFQDHQLHTADVVAATLRAELTGAARALRLYAAAVARRPDSREAFDLLRSQVGCVDAPCFAGLALYSLQGAVVHVAGRAPGLAPVDLTPPAPSPKPARIRTVISTSREPALVFIAPVIRASAEDEGEVTAFIAGEVSFDALLHDSADTLHKSRIEALLFDGRGLLVFRSAHPEMRLNNAQRAAQGCSSCHQSFDHVKKMLTMSRGTLRYTLRGEPKLGAAAPFDFEGERWVAAMTAPAHAAVGVLALEFRQLAMLMFGTVVALGLTVQASWVQRRRLMQAQADASRREHLERSHAALTALNARLEHAAAEWRTTVDTIDAALMVLDPTDRIQRMNRAASDTLPDEPFAWLGRASADLAACPPWDSALTLAREAVESRSESSARVHYASTGKTWDLWCRTPRDGSSVVIVARDATALVELQQSLRHSETMAALGSVVVGVAHEVRNPLFAISSLVDAWSVQPTRDPSPYLDALRREVGRVNSLMTELLEYGRPTKVVLEPGPVGTVIDDAVRACAAEARLRQIAVSVGDAPDAQVWMDNRRLARVFINLIQNAIQHAPAGSVVSVDASAQPAGRPRHVAVSVRDRGCGFAEADLPQVFTPFFSRRPGGFGLGLALSQRITAEHRGTIAAANHPDGGATVTVTLPLGPPERPVRVCEGARPC